MEFFKFINAIYDWDGSIFLFKHIEKEDCFIGIVEIFDGNIYTDEKYNNWRVIGFSPNAIVEDYMLEEKYILGSERETNTRCTGIAVLLSEPIEN